MPRRRIVEVGQSSFDFAPPPVHQAPPRAPAHHCHLPGCDVEVPPRLLMCRKHWGMVPASIQRQVWRHFDPQQCSSRPDRPLPTESWHEAADAAIDAVLDALGDRLVKDLARSPRTATALEDEPPAGMTAVTLRRVMNRLFRTKRLRYDEQQRVSLAA